jgi:twitching motility protein PilI
MHVPGASAEQLGSLQAFQQQLTERLHSAQQAQQREQFYLACTMGARRWLFELGHTDQILAGEIPTPVPFTRPWFLGLVNHRGQLINVIDLDGFAGAAPRPWQREDRLLVLSSDLPLRCALRVTPSATEADHRPGWLPHRFIAADGTDYLSVDLVALMALPAFLDIAQPDTH